MSTVSVRFSSKYYGAAQALHSFPTRRSSDLLQRAADELEGAVVARARPGDQAVGGQIAGVRDLAAYSLVDRKSTRLNSSHTVISYAVFCLKKKKPLDPRLRRRVRVRLPDP